jgi:hypothetical protein
MNQKLTIRETKYLAIAKTDSYTREELKMLEGLLYDHLVSSYENSCDWDAEEIRFVVQEYLEHGGISIDNTSKSFNFLQYLLVYYRKFFLFLTCVPLSNLPLYLNKKTLRIFCLWRMKIHR